MRIVSGIQPTGNLHLGNYLGAIRNWVRMQDEVTASGGLSLYFLADLHALSQPHVPAELAANTREMTAALIACGIDPERSIVFNQAQVPAHAELQWLLNGTARFGWLNRRASRRTAAEWCRAFDIAAAGLDQKAILLSGGNQQKVLLARWAATDPTLLILNDPTRGIDVRTREAIHRRIEEWANAGRAVLLVTSDTQELLRLADRIVVLRAGRVVRELNAEEADEHRLLAAMNETAV